MRFQRKPWGTVLAAALIATGVTHAQSPVPGADPSASGKPVKAVKLSLPEMVARAGTLEVQIKADLRHVLHLQTKARQAKDVIKLNCINDKLVQLKAQVNIFDSAHASLRAGLEDEGAGAGAGDARQAAFGEVTEVGSAVKTLRAEADICVGEPELFKQESSSDVLRPEIVDDPGGFDPFDPSGGPFEPPAYASPFN
ncbi:MAG TPA: hypothetical protein VK932_04835 [Kofleriaceae bacterium]|nr:hypothetical protein [Kofleriaceae bacterium]